MVASGAYPEGLLWHGGRMYFTEMGADRVSLIENGGTREFWRQANCGPTSIAPFGPAGFLVNCHLGREMVEVSAQGTTGRKFRSAPNGRQIQNPNASAERRAGRGILLRLRLLRPAGAGDRHRLSPERHGHDD